MLNILIVDDEESTRFYLKRIIIKKFGFKVTEASNGSEALEILEKAETPDIVFLDISMPVMDGIECLRQIRRNSQLENLKVVVMTAHNDKDTVSQFLQLGIQDYILKPFGYYKTFERIQEILFGLKRIEEEPGEEDEIIEKSPKLKIVIADGDINFRTLFNNLLSSRFRIIESSDGNGCIQSAENTNPDYIIIGENLKIKDESSFIEKLRETDIENKSKIFLCTDVPEDDSINCRLYDGILQKSFLTDIFMKEFATKVLKYSSLYSMVNDIFDTYLKHDIMKSIKQTFRLKSGNDIHFLNSYDEKNFSNKILSKAELISEDDDFILNIGIVSNEKDAAKVVSKLADKPYKVGSGDYKNLTFICQILAAKIRLVTEKYGLKTDLQSPVIKNIFLNTFKSYWKMILPVSVTNDISTIVGINLEKKS